MNAKRKSAVVEGFLSLLAQLCMKLWDLYKSFAPTLHQSLTALCPPLFVSNILTLKMCEKFWRQKVMTWQLRKNNGHFLWVPRHHFFGAKILAPKFVTVTFPRHPLLVAKWSHVMENG